MQDSYLVNVNQESMDGLEVHLKRYRLRLNVHMERMDYDIWQAWNKKCALGSVDPRHQDLGYRILLPKGQAPELSDFERASHDKYLEHRYKLGIAEGPSEIATLQALPLEHNFDYLNGIDFGKGCYLGQELTIRTHHTGVVRKRVMPVRLVSGTFPETQTTLYFNDKKAGKFLKGTGNYGIALLRLEFLSTDARKFILECDGSLLEATAPKWFNEK